MLKYNKLLIIIIAVSLLFAGNVFARNFSVAPEFEDGEIISADVFNELFGYIENASNNITAADLIGEWSCVNFVANGDLVRPGDMLDAQGFYGYKMITIIFSDDGDGTYSWRSISYNPFNRLNDDNHVGAEEGSFTVFNNVLFADYANHSDWPLIVCEINKVSPSRLMLRNAEHGGGPESTIWMVCDNQSIAPEKPTKLRVTDAGFAVTLNWQDNSDNETGFIIFRKDHEDKKWVELGSVPAGITVYNDVVSHKGKFWYRVRASNSFGESAGSNVAKATIN